MASTGGAAAYQKLTAPEDGLSRSMQYWGGLFAQQAEHNRDREDKEKIRKQKEVSDWEEKNQMGFDDFKQTITGYNTYDDVGRSYAQKAMDAYVDQYNKAEEAMKNGKTKEMQSYRNNMLKIKGTFGQIKDMNVSLAKRNAEYEDMVSKGLMSGVDKKTWEAQNYALLGRNFDIDLDSNYNPVVKGITNLGEDPTAEQPFEIPYNQMVNGDWRAYKRQELAGKGGLIPTVLDSLGTYEEEKRANGNIINAKLWTPKLATGAEQLIKPMLESDEVMADLTNQFDNNSTKRTGFTDEEKQAMQTKLVGMIEAGYSEKYKEAWDKDYATLNETKRHNKKTEGIAQQNANSNTTRAANDTKRTQVYGYRAETDRKKLEMQNEKDKPLLKVSTNYIDRVKQNGKFTNIPFQSYTLTDKNSVVQPFIISSKTDADGNPQVVKATSVDVSSDGSLMKVFIEGQKNPSYISKKGSAQSRAIFEKIESQMGDRKAIGVDIFGEGPDKVESAAPKKATKTLTDDEIRQKYKF